MGEILEAKYIHIIWQDKTTAKKIVESIDPLEIESIDLTTCQVDIVSYSKINDGSQGQFAIRLKNESTEVPYFILGNNTRLNLLPVHDPVTGICWWVEGKTWDNKSQRWLSDIYRGAGQVKIQVGSYSCLINISSSTFTHQQLEGYLRDFRSDFWELILDDSSYISGAAKHVQNGQVDEDTLQAIRKFIECINLILQKPKAELREIQCLKPQKEVRPVPRTFMELSTRGHSRTLTSRGYQESLDVPDNRYAHYILRRVYLITKALCTVADSKKNTLQKSLEANQFRLSELSGEKIINQEAAMLDLQDKEHALEELKNSVSARNLEFAQQIKNQPVTRGYYQPRGDLITHLRVEPQKQADNLMEKPFFSNVRSSASENWFQPENGYVTVDFGDYSSQIETGFEYEIQGEIYFTEQESNGKLRYNYKLFVVTSFRICRTMRYSKLNKRIREDKCKIDLLEQTNWTRSLTSDEAEQQRRDMASIERIMSLLNANKENLNKISKELTPKLPVLRAALAVFEKAKVKQSSRFPNSMTYIQNPSYQGIHSNFTKIKELSGIDNEDILMALDRVEDIGLVNISMLYERWSLLQIIKVLMFNYHFKPEETWKRKLITQTLDKGRNISINFKNLELKRQIKLHYEMELDSGKRPDFVLDVEAVKNSDESLIRKRFVLDAKFYQDINNRRHGGILNVIDGLYNGKNYSEDGKNTVFVIHPSSASVLSRKTPQVWSKDNYYGEVGMGNQANNLPNHRYGAVYLSPIARGSYLDPLQRAIGMFLQYGVEDNNPISGDLGAQPDTKMFCLVCGSSNLSCERSRKNQSAWWVTCCDCKHFTTYNYCRSCKNRLIKNGEYWSYHSMEPLNPINIKCPSCGDLL